MFTMAKSMLCMCAQNWPIASWRGNKISFVHSFIHGCHQYVVRACVCLCVYIAVGRFLHMCMCVFMWLWVGFACVHVCTCVLMCLEQIAWYTDLCRLLWEKKNLLIGEGEWGGAQLRMKEGSGTGLRRCGIHLNQDMYPQCTLDSSILLMRASNRLQHTVQRWCGQSHVCKHAACRRV